MHYPMESMKVTWKNYLTLTQRHKQVKVHFSWQKEKSSLNGGKPQIHKRTVQRPGEAFGETDPHIAKITFFTLPNGKGGIPLPKKKFYWEKLYQKTPHSTWFLPVFNKYCQNCNENLNSAKYVRKVIYLHGFQFFFNIMPQTETVYAIYSEFLVPTLSKCLVSG